MNLPNGTKPNSFRERFRNLRHLYLLVALLALIVLYPFIQAGPFATFFILALNWLVLVTAAYAVADSRLHRVIATALAASTILLAFVTELVPDGHVMYMPLEIADSVMTAVFYVYVIIQMMKYILRRQRVDQDILFSGLSVYLLMGLAWCTVYSVLERAAPGSFQFSVDPRMHGGLQLIYFSFVTMTTLGYGDITPLTDRARSFVILETISGQLYLAVMVARLVSTYRPARLDDGEQ